MPGILTLPNGVKNPPVIILVHGSGPNDKDESLGPNKTFKDLAIGFARKGFATIRYDKRTKVYGSQLAKNTHDATVNDETIDDVISAVNMADTMKGLDNKRIYVVGHSLGAMLAPRIASQSKKIKAIVMMAGDSRLLEDVMIYQMGYLASLDTTDMKEKQMSKDAMVKKLEYAKSPNLKPDAPDSLLPYGVSAPYWIDINHYNQIKTAEELKIPILILQGERDYQVTMDDFNLWKEKLGNHKNVTLKSYPKLNHLFMEGDGKSTPQEYEKPNHVPLYVITDIANWLNK
jgi:dienelactone hydrolase